MSDVFLSSILSRPASYCVYSLMSAYGPRRGGELPGAWFVAALAAVGHAEATVRQTLFRMERNQELETRVEGRRKFYRLSPYAAAEAAAGLEKIRGATGGEWDGAWYLLSTGFTEAERVERDRIRALLAAEGFAPLGRGLYLHPRDRTGRIVGALKAARLEHRISIFRGTHVGGEPMAAMALRLWRPARLARQYRAFIARYGPVRPMKLADPPAAFRIRLALVFDYLEMAWGDPELPEELLPRPWPGSAARLLARELYERALPGSHQFCDALYDQVMESRTTGSVRKKIS